MTEINNKTQITHTLGDREDIKRVVELAFGTVPYVSARALWLSGLIYWVKSYRTVMNYVNKNYSSIFSPHSQGENSGKRYMVSQESIIEFIYRFETNQLSSQI